MLDSMMKRLGSFSRRDLVRRGGLAAAVAALAGRPGKISAAPPVTAGKLQIGPDIYKSIGVRPIINCRGTLTVFGGSLELPEVRAAKDAAAMHFVQLDELAEGIGRRLAELTGAEWGLVSSGCAAGLAHATTACVTGGNPDLHTRVPDLTGFPKDEVVIPRHSRNQYDQAVRSVGVRIIEAADAAEYEAALGPKVAMVYVFAGPNAERGPLPYDAIYGIAKKRNVPVLVDAAAEMLTIPNVHLQRGATLVGYSGGKCIRGPQSAGLLLGRKDLVQAAWVASAPHHGHGRTMKVGKEEAMAMLAAVEMWVGRDHKAEYQSWENWMNHIAGVVSKTDGVKATVREPEGLSNHTPSLNISWDPAQLGVTGDEVGKELFTTEPRIAIGSNEHGLSITAYMMSAGEEKIVADRISQILSRPRPKMGAPKTPAGDLTGRWDVKIDFVAGSTTHHFYVKQQENKLVGTHQGDFVARDFRGTISGDQVLIASAVGENHGAAMSFRFAGKLDGDKMSGTLDMGEYLGAKWTATRHSF
ncbi:MAG TPA: aminotransferase class V-fold PLP-dependent enzyme [Bryobacteraceae bacterium]|nr:aminotransferase class V-fold PLP-dependent enzyme [Bryobacteraceae bacterium]